MVKYTVVQSFSVSLLTNFVLSHNLSRPVLPLTPQALRAWRWESIAVIACLVEFRANICDSLRSLGWGLVPSCEKSRARVHHYMYKIYRNDPKRMSDIPFDVVV